MKSYEKPLIQQRIELIAIDELFGHEQVVQSQVEWLKNNILELGYFFRPILITKSKDHVVLDGHHRVVALKELGYSKIPCILIDYLDNEEIQLGTWIPVYLESIDKNFPNAFEDLKIEWIQLESFSPETLNDPDCAFILKTISGQFLLKGTQQDIFAEFLKKYNSNAFEYTTTVELAINKIETEAAEFALLRKALTKQDVVSTALNKKPFAPKTTRHILSFRYQDIKVPLKNLE